MSNCNSCFKNRIHHFKPRRKPMMQSRPERCDICEVENWSVAYCSFCHKWLCDSCRKDPIKRFKGMTKELKKKFINKT